MGRMKGFAVLQYFGYDSIKFLLLVLAFLVIILFFMMAFPDLAEAARNLFTTGRG
jgi:hypothetical protein